MAHKNKPLTQADKGRLIADRLRVAPELSDRTIARMLGVSPTTVGSVRRELADKTVQNGQVDTQAEEAVRTTQSRVRRLFGHIR